MKNLVIIGLIALVVIVGALAYTGMKSGEDAAPITTGTPKDQPVAMGRVVFSVTDAAVSLDGLEAILLSVTEVRVHSATKGWITVSEENKQFDLLALKSSGSLALLADAHIDSGVYDQIRLSVKN